MFRRTLRPLSQLGIWSTLLVLIIALTGAAQPAQEKAKTDQSGDALPAGALARMGTLRWRHGEAITFVACTPDGKSVITASQDGVLRLWDRETGKVIRRFETKAAQPALPAGGMGAWGPLYGGTTRVALTQDGKVLASVLASNEIQFWEVDTGKEIRRIKGPNVGVNTLVLAPDGKSIATRGYDSTIYLLDSETGKEIRQIKGKQQQGGVRILVLGQAMGSAGLAYSHDGKTIASAEIEYDMQKSNSFLKFSVTDTGKEIRKIDTNPDGVSAIAYAKNGKMLVYGSGNDIRLCDADGKDIRKIDNSTGVAGLAFDPDSKVLAAKGRDGVIRLFDASNGKSIHTFGEAVAAPGNVAFVNFNMPALRDFAFGHDGKTVAVGSGQVLRFFAVASGKEQAATGGSGHRSAVSAVVLTPDGKTMLSRGADGVIRRWEAGSGKELGQFTEPKGTSGAVFAPDGKTVALANADGSIRLHAVADGKELHQLKGHTNGIAALAFSPNSKTLASRGSNDNIIRLFDAVQGGELKQITIPNANAGANPGGGFGGYYGATGTGLAFSPDGQTVAGNVSAGNNFAIRGQPPQANPGTLYQWDVTTGKELRKITLPTSRSVVSLAYSPDGRLLATENADQTVSLWELASGRERALLGTPSAAPVGVPGGMGRFIIVGQGGGIRTPLASTTLAFSGDGSLLAVRAAGNAARVYEVIPAKEIHQFKGHESAIAALAFARDGKTLATGSADTTCLVWDLANLKREPKAESVKLAGKDLDSLWADLIGEDAGKASLGITKLSNGAKDAAPWLSEKLKPATPPDVQKIDGWINDLNSPNFQKRMTATAELEKLGELAIPALKKLHANPPSVEARRRVEPILEKLTTGTLTAEQIRVVRAVEALERMGASDARSLLESLAGGAPGALPTRQAKAALDRMGKR